MSPNTNTGNTSCTVTADAGFHIVTLTLSGVDDVTGATGTPTVTFGGTVTQTVNLFGVTFCSATYPAFPCNDTVTGSPATGLNLATYTISITNGSNSVAGGSIVGASEQLTLNATQSPNSGVPEPATLGVMGGGLLGLGLLGRRKRK